MAGSNYKLMCAHCNCLFESRRKKMYCTKQCCSSAQNRKKRPVSREEYDAKRRAAANHFKCEHCGKDAHRKLSGTNKARGGVNRFCSMQCRKDAATAAAIKPAPFSLCYAAHCKTCSKPFVSRRKRLYCCDKCAPAYEYVSIAPALKICRCCGNEYKPVFTGGRPSEYCSQVCLDLVNEAARRVSKAKRKALLRGATVESVDPHKVFDRDKWRCQLCGIKTPRAKRGTFDDDAPELDHIIPLAGGGEHSYRNTQCSCRKCNGLKSDRPMGQMLLVG